MAGGRLDKDYQAAIDAGKINGAIFCATDSKGQFVYNKTIGQRTLPSGEKKHYETDDIQCLASATKLMATIAALTCVEDGLLSLTADLSSIVPELGAKQVLTGFTEGGDAPLLEAQTTNITLEMLLTHSSGLVYPFLPTEPSVSRWREKFSGQPAPQPTDRKTVEEMFGFPLVFQPGSSWMYGVGLDWAGRAVERVTGRTLGERLDERVFGPLGITDAQFYPVTREDLRSRQTDLTSSDPEGTGAAVFGGDGSFNTRTKGHFGGHSLFMSATDYLKVLRSLMLNDGKILKPSTVDDMFRDHLGREAAAGRRTALESPLGPHFACGVGLETKTGHGLGGLVTLEDVEGWYGEGTMTWGGGQTITWFVDRKNDLCGFAAVQATIPADIPTLMELKQKFRKEIYRERDEAQ